MKMIRVKFISQSGNNPEELPDEAYIDENGDLETEIKKAIDEFNEEEIKRYGTKANLRKFVRLIDTPIGKVHKWEKISFYGQKTRYGTSYDLWRCEGCGLERKVISLDSVPRDAGECYPERTCAICQKVFKTEANYLKHLQSALHYKNEQKKS